jgi:hypothetical protein
MALAEKSRNRPENSARTDTMGTLVPLTSDDWARVRYDYESTARKLFDICAEHGISERTLHDRVRRWGWKRRSSGLVAREGPPPMVVTRIEVDGAVPRHGAQGRGGDPPENLDALRDSLKREIDAIIEQEREARPRRYLAAWEEFAAEAAKQRGPSQDADRRRRQRAPQARPTGEE